MSYYASKNCVVVSAGDPGHHKLDKKEPLRTADGFRARIIKETATRIDDVFSKITNPNHREHIHLPPGSPMVESLKQILLEKGYCVNNDQIIKVEGGDHSPIIYDSDQTTLVVSL